MRSLLLSLLIFSQTANAQPGRSPGSPGKIPAETPGTSYQRVFLVNSAATPDEVFNRARRFVASERLYVTESKPGHILRAKFLMTYTSTGNQCIESLDIKGTIKMEFKGNKTRILLENMSYIHKDKSDGSVKAVAKSNLFSVESPCAPSAGKLEELYHCSRCQKSIRSLTEALTDRFDQLASQYQQSLKTK